ncbi:hypothetical protein MMC27_000154 [Xylographa pallens]|nr:hypothetical protein [Xylographa pallens]
MSINWEEIRDRVKVLYLEKANTLVTTRKKIKDEYNLDASEKAFKQWRREWGFKKYIKKPDQEYIVKTDQQRKLLSQKSSIFRFQGDIVSEAKIRKWAKVIDRSTTISSPPPYITCVTPPLQCQKPPRLNFVATKRLRHALDTDTAISLLPLKFDNSSATTKNDINPSDNPLYTKFFLPLQQSVMQISISRLSSNGLLGEDTRDDTAIELEDALDAFIEQCSQHDELAFALTCFTIGELSRLASGVFSNESIYAHGGGLNVCGFGLDAEEIDLVHDILEKIRYNTEESDFALGLLSYLRRRYDETRDERALTPVLKTMEEILHQMLPANSGQHGSPLVIHSISGLLKSYYRLAQPVAVEKWRQELIRQVVEEDKWEAGLYTSSPDYPLRLMFKQFLWEDWPCISLPWDKPV